MGTNIMMQGVRSLYGSTTEGLKMEKLNGRRISLTGIDIMSMIIIISLVIQTDNILSFKKVA